MQVETKVWDPSSNPKVKKGSLPWEGPPEEKKDGKKMPKLDHRIGPCPTGPFSVYR
jgi:hypothetical protein